MTTGPVSPLSFAGTPLFFNAFNRVEEFLEANGWADALAKEGSVEVGSASSQGL
jgi:hypothetical protein